MRIEQKLYFKKTFWSNSGFLSNGAKIIEIHTLIGMILVRRHFLILERYVSVGCFFCMVLDSHPRLKSNVRNGFILNSIHIVTF